MKVESSRLVGFGVGALMSTAAVTGLFARSDLDDRQPLQETQELLAETMNDSEEQAHNTLRLEQQLGESCVSAIIVYLPGQVLEDTDEEIVVKDLLAPSSKPCGDTPTDARVAIRSLTDATQSRFWYESVIRELKSQETVQQHELDDQQWPNGLLLSAVLAPFAGIAVARFNTRSKKYTGKTRW